MIAVTDNARQKLTSYLQEKNISSPLRISLVQAGCSGVTLGLALDETREDDWVESIAGLTIAMEKNLLAQCGSVCVDFIDSGNRSGFSVTAAKPLPRAASGCAPGSGSCGAGGCCR